VQSRSEAPREGEQLEAPPAPRRRSADSGGGFDWLTEVAIPICVFGLLGSLLYYLIEVRATLAGPGAVGPLRWVVFWFLLACIGIARIRTRYGGAGIAGYYSVLLAGAMLLFVWVYTGRVGGFYGGGGSRWIALLFNWALVGVVWWAATAVTREATLEENVETQLEGGLWTLLADEWRYPEPEDHPADEEIDHAQVRPRHPGRLVLWVSLAALVLFAVGQRTTGSQSQHARTAFWCMSAYVLFALLLLALTNLSALRMQVRRRGISLAPAVTPAWIAASSIVVLLIVVFSASMPRAEAPGEPQFITVPQWLTDNRRPGMEQGPAQGLGPRGQAPGEGKQQSGAREPGGDEQGPGEQRGERGEGERPGEGAGGIFGQWQAPGAGGEGQGAGSGQGEDRGQSAQQPRSQPWASLLDDLTPLARLLLILLLAMAAIALLYFMWLHRQAIRRGLRRVAAHLREVAAWIAERIRQLLQRLRLPTWGTAREGNLPADPFVDIFQRGLDAQLEPAEVVRYVYRAFQAYAAMGGYERRDDQTALEFLDSLPPALELPNRGAQRLTRAYVLATYSPREVTRRQVEGVRETWRIMSERVRQMRRASA